MSGIDEKARGVAVRRYVSGQMRPWAAASADRSGNEAIDLADPSVGTGRSLVSTVLQLSVDPTVQRLLAAGFVLLGLAGLWAAGLMARQALRDRRRERLKRRV
jgi:hypothetical protein